MVYDLFVLGVVCVVNKLWMLSAAVVVGGGCSRNVVSIRILEWLVILANCCVGDQVRTF